MLAIRASVNQFDGGNDNFRRIEHLLNCDVSSLDAIADDESQLNFDLGVAIVRCFQLAAIAEQHVIKQIAVIRFVNIHR